jgi:hypothetical protein
MHETVIEFPRQLSGYPAMPGQPLWDVLRARIEAEPFNAFATAIFFVAVLHTFAASRFTDAAHRIQHRHDERLARNGQPSHPSPLAEACHFLGEVEVVFGLWSLALLAAIISAHDWSTAVHYVNSTVNYTEPLFVIVIMALASTRPIVNLAESALRQLARLGGSSPAAWWVVILTIGPVLGSFITEPAAMTISALLLARQFFDLSPSAGLRYATLGLLFVNVSIGGTLTHFAAPPVLIVAREWQWDTPFMLSHFGWRSVLAIVVSTALYFMIYRRDLTALASKAGVPDAEVAAEEATETQRLLPVPAWVTLAHIGFMIWTVVNSHYPALFIGGFLFFLGFARATAAYQSRLDMKTPMLVGFFLAGIVIHGGVQGWWIAPVLSSLSEDGLFWAAAVLTAFNDNALITKLATLVPNFADAFKIAVVEGAVTGGGLTVIANAPNPAGQALLSRFFGGAVSPFKLMLAALLPTLIAAAAFRLF